MAEGHPADVLTPALIEEVHGVRAGVTRHPGHPVICFLRGSDTTTASSPPS